MHPQKPQAPQAAPKTVAPPRKVLVDGTTVELAQKLGLSIEEYVERVVGSLLHPPQEPVLSVVVAPEPQAPVSREPAEAWPVVEPAGFRSATQRKVG